MNLILCIVIVIISTAMGRLLAGRASDRLVFIREYQLAFTHLSDKVVGLNLELYKALLSSRSGRISPVFDSCASALKRTPQASFTQIWDKSFTRSRDDFSFLTNEDIQIILEGGGAIEALCKNPSEKQAGLYLKRLSEYMSTLETEKIKKCKLYNTAGVLTGLMIALLVI
jgi:stage III sporulation protein AB